MVDGESQPIGTDQPPKVGLSPRSGQRRLLRQMLLRLGALIVGGVLLLLIVGGVLLLLQLSGRDRGIPAAILFRQPGRETASSSFRSLPPSLAPNRDRR